MKRMLSIMTVFMFCAAGFCAEDAPEKKKATPEAAHGAENVNGEVNEDETAILQAIDSYVDAFNQGDATALADHWSEHGQFTTPAGKTLQGRKQLEEDFTAYFNETKNAKIELVDTAIDFLSPSVAIETGIARVIVPEQEPHETDYEVIHVRTAEGWKIDSIREQELSPPPPTHYEQLRDLEWMIGRWIDSEEGTTIETVCRWTTNRNFIVRSFQVAIQDRIDFSGTQVIGWDPHAGAIRAWMFDSDGGFGVGRWSMSGNRWTVHALNVLHDGRRASATNIYDVVDEDTVQFSSIGRQVDGELLPNIAPVTMVRASD